MKHLEHVYKGAVPLGKNIKHISSKNSSPPLLLRFESKMHCDMLVLYNIIILYYR